MLNHRELLDIEYLAQKYNEANIPLYLSYPISSYWKMQLDESVYLRAFSDTKASFLYFHFPYCARACYYCACYKTTTLDPQQNEIYIQSLIREFNSKCHLLGIERFRNIKHMHWGGGTPSYLTPAQIERVFTDTTRRIELASHDQTSISVEAYPDPEELTLEKLSLLRSLGFNEISFGIQDFDENIQHAIHRDTPAEVVGDIIAASRDLGFRVHVDLCYGLPFQGINELKNTLQTVIRMSPDRIALFSYAHFPLLFPMQRNIPISSLPNSFLRVLLNMTASQILESHGYLKVGYDHFVKPNNSLYRATLSGTIVRDFMGYSVDQRREFIGFGNAAISFFGNVFFQNALTLDHYFAAVEKNQLPLHLEMGHVLSVDDRLRNQLIQQHILGNFAIPTKEIAQEHNIDFKSFFCSELSDLSSFFQDDLLEDISADTISLTLLGRYFARHIAQVFDKYK